MVKGVLYTTAGTRRSVIALDAATGELLWVHRYPEGPRGAAAPRQLSGRGLAYWTDGHGDDRIIYVTPGYRLIALDAKTGQPVRTFGKDGVVDMKVGVVFGNDQQIDLETGEIGLHSTPVVAKDVVLVGSSMKEGMTITTHNNTKGVARALRRAHRQAAVDVQHDSRGPASSATTRWLDNSWAINGNVGVWTQISVDEELGLVYLPVETPTSDFYGGKRPGQQPVCREPRVRRSRHREAQVALPVRAPSDLERRHVVGAAPRGRHDRRQAAEGRRRAEQAGVAVRLRSRHRRADLADRGEAGAEG